MKLSSYKLTHKWTHWWRPPEFGWRYLNYVMIVLGLIVGFGLWLMPNKWAEPEIAAGFAEQVRLERLAKQLERQREEHQRMVDELGLVYIEPGTNPFLPPQAQPDGKSGGAGQAP